MKIETTAVLVRHGDNGSKHLQNTIIRALHKAKKQGINNSDKLLEIIRLMVNSYS